MSSVGLPGSAASYRPRTLPTLSRLTRMPASRIQRPTSSCAFFIDGEPNGRVMRSASSLHAASSSHLAMTVSARCDELAACSEEAERITRPFGSPSMKKAQELVGRWILEAGMRVSRDNVGNVLGRYEAADPGSPTLLMGSHLDTVRGAGKY